MNDSKRPQAPHPGTGVREALEGAGNSGLYWLRVDLPRPLRIAWRGNSHRVLPEGAYLYTGSARRGLSQRVARHLRRIKPLRWHVDRLTTHPKTRLLGAVLLPHIAVSRLQDGLPQHALTECALNALAGRLDGASAPVPGFGASDCRAGCPAHLWRLGDLEYSEERNLEALAALLGAYVDEHLPRDVGTAPPRAGIVHVGKRQRMVRRKDETATG